MFKPRTDTADDRAARSATCSPRRPSARAPTPGAAAACSTRPRRASRRRRRAATRPPRSRPSKRVAWRWAPRGLPATPRPLIAALAVAVRRDRAGRRALIAGRPGLRRRRDHRARRSRRARATRRSARRRRRRARAQRRTPSAQRPRARERRPRATQPTPAPRAATSAAAHARRPAHARRRRRRAPAPKPRAGRLPTRVPVTNGGIKMAARLTRHGRTLARDRRARDRRRARRRRRIGADAALRDRRRRRRVGRRRVRALYAVHRSPRRLHDPDRQRVRGPGADLGRAAVRGRRHARRAAYWGSSRSASGSSCCPSRSPRDARAHRTHGTPSSPRCCGRDRPRRAGAGARDRTSGHRAADSGCPIPAISSARSSSSSSRRSSGSRRRSRRAPCTGCWPHPVYTDTSAYAQLNALRASIDVAGVGAAVAGLHGRGGALLRLRDSRRRGPMRRSRRSPAARSRPAAWRCTGRCSGLLAIAANTLTYGITHTPLVSSGLTDAARRGDGVELHAAWTRHDRGGRRGRRSSCC